MLMVHGYILACTTISSLYFRRRREESSEMEAVPLRVESDANIDADVEEVALDVAEEAPFASIRASEPFFPNVLDSSFNEYLASLARSAIVNARPQFDRDGNVNVITMMNQSTRTKTINSIEEEKKE
jgi:hypothetical protein